MISRFILKNIINAFSALINEIGAWVIYYYVSLAFKNYRTKQEENIK